MGRAYLATGIAENFGGTATPGTNEHLTLYSTDSTTVPVIKWDPNQNILYAENIQLGGTTTGGTVQGQITVMDGAAEMFRLDTINKYLGITGTSAPVNGGALSCKLYLDTSAGKTRLMAIFDTGAAQVVAAEP